MYRRIHIRECEVKKGGGTGRLVLEVDLYKQPPGVDFLTKETIEFSIPMYVLADLLDSIKEASELK